MRKTILVTGVSGQLGGEVFSSKLFANFDLIGTDQEEMDLADEEQIRATVQSTSPAIIIHCAAYTAVDQAENEEAQAYRINARAPEILAEEAKRLGALLIHISTDYVFPGYGDHFQDETTATGPLNVYGASKLAGEQAIQRVGGQFVILRTSWVYGPTGNNFLHTMLRLGKERTSLRVVADQFGAPTSVQEITRGIAAVVERYSAGSSGVYHLVCAGETSWHGFASSIFAGARRRGVQLAVADVAAIATADYPTPAKRPFNSRLDCRKFTAQFGVTPARWEDALDEVLDV